MKFIAIVCVFLVIISGNAFAYQSNLLECLKEIHGLTKNNSAIKLIPFEKSEQSILLVDTPGVYVFSE